MEPVYLLFDVGGTEIKCGMAEADGAIRQPLLRFPAKAKEIQAHILDHFAWVVQTLAGQAGERRIGGVGMAFPGPFDYEHGISRMRGLDKYDSIYGVPLEKEIKKRAAAVQEARFVFLHDIEAFALGSSRFGPAKQAGRILCLCMGTGAGSAFVCHQRIVKQGKGIPLNGWIYQTPFHESVIDDYLSVRGLARLSREIMGRERDGRTLYECCQKGDCQAMEVYRRFGAWIREAMVPFMDAFLPDAMLLGGQIAGSFPFVGGALREECKKRAISVYLEKDTSIRAMQGLYAWMQSQSIGQL